VVAAAAAALAATSTAIKALPEWYQSSLAIRMFEVNGALCRPALWPSLHAACIAMCTPAEWMPMPHQERCLHAQRLHSKQELHARLLRCVPAVLTKAAALYRAAQQMGPEAGRPLTELSAWAGAQAADLVGVQAFGSSSVLDDMALAAGWLAVATGAHMCVHTRVPAHGESGAVSAHRELAGVGNRQSHIIVHAMHMHVVCCLHRQCQPAGGGAQLPERALDAGGGPWERVVLLAHT
jgi:hypothetical protein